MAKLHNSPHTSVTGSNSMWGEKKRECLNFFIKYVEKNTTFTGSKKNYMNVVKYELLITNYELP